MDDLREGQGGRVKLAIRIHPKFVDGRSRRRLVARIEVLVFVANR